MGYDKPLKQARRFTVEHVRKWFRGREERPAPRDDSGPPEPILIGDRPVRPFEDESSDDFSERVARIKADLLSRALKAKMMESENPRDRPRRTTPPKYAREDWGSVEPGRHPWSVERRRAQSPVDPDATEEPTD